MDRAQNRPHSPGRYETRFVKAARDLALSRRFWKNRTYLAPARLVPRPLGRGLFAPGGVPARSPATANMRLRGSRAEIARAVAGGGLLQMSRRGCCLGERRASDGTCARTSPKERGGISPERRGAENICGGPEMRAPCIANHIEYGGREGLLAEGNIVSRGKSREPLAGALRAHAVGAVLDRELAIEQTAHRGAGATAEGVVRG